MFEWSDLRYFLAVARNGSTIVLIDQKDELPASIAAVTTKFELSLPDEKELEDLVKQTLREINAQQRLDVQMTKKGLNTAVKTLRGLSRRQVRQVIIDSVANDLRFDDADVAVTLLELLDELRRERKLTLIIATHAADVAVD